MSTNVSTPSTDTDMIPRFGPVDANNRTTEPSKVTSNDAPAATDVADEPPERCGDDDNHQPDENTNPTSVFSNRTAGTGASVVASTGGSDSADSFPAASNADTVYAYVDSATKPESVNSAITVVSTSTPSRNTRYPATPVSSVDASHTNDTDTSDTPATTTFCGTDGSSVSTGGSPTWIMGVLAEMLPALSAARTK